MSRLRWVSTLAMIAIAGCGENTGSRDTESGRWYSDAQVARGALLYKTHCAVCHGENAEATNKWRTVDANGNYPPPPLNGTAHAWHHPRSVLLLTIAQGGRAFGGVMPAFADVLTEDDALVTIAYFQSHWPDEIYTRWLEIDSR